MSGNCDISQLYQLCQGGCHTISSDIVCVGRVTSSDSEGNFYRSMFVEDSTAAVEILLGTYNIARFSELTGIPVNTLYGYTKKNQYRPNFENYVTIMALGESGDGQMKKQRKREE